MPDRITGYGVGSPKIFLAPVPFEIRRLLLNNIDTQYNVGQLAYQTVTSSFVLYDGHGTWIPIGGAGSPLQTINAVAPVANNINFTSTGGTILITPLGGGAGTVNIDLAGGSVGLDSVMVDNFVAPGVNPVVPDGSGLMTVHGVAIASGSGVPIQTISRNVNEYNVEVQRGSASAATNATAQGLVSFDSSAFTVDANGWVQLKGSLSLTATSPAGLAPQFAQFVIPASYIVNNTSVTMQVLWVGRRQAAPNESAYGEYISGYRVNGAGAVTVSPVDDSTVLGDLAVEPSMGLSSPGANQVTFVISDQSGTGPIDWRANFTLTIIP